MRKVPLFVIEFIAESINPNIIEKITSFSYEESSNLNPKDWFCEYVKMTLTNTFGYYAKEGFYPKINYVDIDVKDIRYNMNKYRQQNKRNWVKSLISSLKKPNNPIEQEINSWKIVNEQLLASNSKFKIQDELGVDKLDDLLPLRIAQLEEWAKDQDSNIADFRYLSSKQKYQIEKGLEYDLIISIANIIINDFDSDLFKSIDATPHALWDNPLFSEKATKLKLQSEYDAENNEEIYFSEYNIDEDRLLRTIIKLEDGDTIHTNKNIFKSLDEIDKQIILHVLREKDESFYTEGKISIFITDLLSKMGLTKGTKNYQTIEAKLEKIKSFEFQAIIKKKSDKFRDGKARWSIFSDIVINNDEDGRRYADITVGKFVHQQIINKQTVEIYSNVLDRIQGKTSKILVHALQKERIDRYLQNRSMTDIFPYQFFTGKVRFSKRKVDANLKTIEESLLEFKHLNIMIQDFKRMDKSFEITFIPLSNTEIHDFFQNNEDHVQLALPL